jgi:DNA-directed RNA polymerase subunit RPC12/RpoP
LPADHAWCMKCNQSVELINPKIKTVNRYLELLQATCPHCGNKINRARARHLPSPNGRGAGGRERSS